MGGGAGVVQGGEDTRGATFLDEVTYDLVVEVFDGVPLDLLPDILLLLGLECQLNENLLQLLVDVVDTKLLERVVLRFSEQYIPMSRMIVNTSKISKPKIS